MLARGFALVLREGRVVSDSAAVAAGDRLRVALSRGWLDARVDARDEGKDPLPGRAGPGPGAIGPGRGGPGR